MDISAVLPSSMGQAQSDSTSSLNEEFSATTPNGDKVFTKPVGEKTVFSTPNGGQVTVAFIFDPDEEFTSNDTIASISTDYMTDLREAFTKYALKPEDIAPKTKSLEETVWDQITSLLPKETLAKNVFSDKAKLDDYMSLVTKVTTQNYNEEQKLSEFMRNQAFCFSFRIAVDAYPDGDQKKKKERGKSGVLTFHLEGSLIAKTDEEESEGKKETKDEEDTENAEVKAEGKDEDGNSNSHSKKRKAAVDDDAVSKKKKTKEEKEVAPRLKVLQELNLVEEMNHARVVRVKEFPLTANLFFESVGRWFSSCVSSKHTKLEKARNKNPLYQ